MTIWTPEFWRDAGERAFKTFAQAALAVIGVTATAGGGILDVDFAQAASVAALAALISLLTSAAANQAAPGSGASWGTAMPLPRETGDPD